ncbi:SRPBCC family protein [Actinomadura rudentiformis]|uniref:SRPBCC family protein n=1 Tax=Actinomadura rudentiformis TaxID=359158 RepID=A0A6H9Z4A7_9ACTN|nr:SRPBCC family protein [Actinomadura rudentiformis]KAB2349469.1 SRPBCC family protein [Actinomadura rudentiformis]
MKPTARLNGNDLVFTRTFKAPIDDVWASVTEPQRTARWFGHWEGDAGPGRTVKVRLLFEEGEPWSDMRIDVCEPPERLLVTADDEAGHWRLELLLTHQNGVTELKLIQHLTTTEGIGETGPGWEYYLDMLVSSREGTPQPNFDDYYPAQKAYFEQLT